MFCSHTCSGECQHSDGAHRIGDHICSQNLEGRGGGEREGEEGERERGNVSRTHVHTCTQTHLH